VAAADEAWERAARVALIRAARQAPEWKHIPSFAAKANWNALIDTVEAAIAGSTAAASWLVAAAGPPTLVPLHSAVVAVIAGWLADPAAAAAAAKRTARAQRDRLRAELWRDRYLWGPIERDLGGPAPALSARLANALVADEEKRTADAIRKAREAVERARERGPWPGLYWIDEDAPGFGPAVRQGRFVAPR
jgi:hypothetical protein